MSLTRPSLGATKIKELPSQLRYLFTKESLIALKDSFYLGQRRLAWKLNDHPWTIFAFGIAVTTLIGREFGDKWYNKYDWPYVPLPEFDECGNEILPVTAPTAYFTTPIADRCPQWPSGLGVRTTTKVEHGH
eukprot:TRINITY_DN1224_c0_g1_i1.p1 TRINITY_DN1224_c0_g1~~TRINITY_DN1224_c0_g1_i1.p1  ORF type:complete len:132 (-),score=23.68 TRINITY_DN1224_c0_g1_i1:145-540(-)